MVQNTMRRSLEITTMIGCPLMCTVCPQDKLKEKYSGEKYLSLDNFVKLIDKVPKDVQIIFSGYAEAWANPNATKMLKYTLENNYQISVFTTLYGMKDPITVVDLLKKYKQQVNQIWLHLPDDSENMPGFKFTKVYETALNKFKQLNPYIMTMSDTTTVHQTLQDIDLNLQKWEFHTRAENIDRNKKIKLSVLEKFDNEFIVDCVRNKDLTDNVLLPNGDITLCCMDYSMKHILGNLFEQSYDDIIKNVKKLIEKNHTLFDKSTLCRNCQDTNHLTPWNDEKVYKMVKQTNPDILGS